MIQKLKNNYTNILSILLIFSILTLTEFVYKDSFMFPYMVFVLFWLSLCLIISFEDILCISLVLLIPEVISIENLPVSVTVIIVLGICVSVLKSYIIDKISIKKIFQFNKSFLLLSLLLVLCGLINLNVHGLKNIFSFIIFLIFVRCVLYKELNVAKLKLYFLFGLMCMILFSIILIRFNIIVDRLIFQGNRLMCFCSNPNQLQIMCIIAMTMTFELLNEKSICFFNFTVMYLFLLVFGFLTLSKAFFLCSIILTFYVFIRLLMRVKKFKLLYIGIFFAIVLILGCIFKNNLSLLLKRFDNKYYDNFFDTLLTGRFSIWKIYLSEYTSSIFNVIFGCGLSAGEMVNIGTHNTYVSLLYRLGIVGLVLLALIIIELFKEKKVCIKLDNSLPLLFLLILFFEEELLLIKYLMIISLICIDFFNNNRKWRVVSE